MVRHCRFACLLFSHILIISAFSSRADAQRSGSGFGIIIGEPTGLSGKFWTSERNAVDVGVAWSFLHEGSFHLHADYLWHSFDVFKSRQPIALFYGIGGRMKASNSHGGILGVRGTIGLDYLVEEAPIDIFIEAAPIMDLTPSTELQFNGGLGFRFFFK
jgi:hypothetical protein